MFIVCFMVRLIINTNMITGVILAVTNSMFVKHVISIVVQVIIGGATYFGMLYVFRDKYLYMIVNKISMKILKKEVI